MAKTPNRWNSNIATDPLRSFRFRAEFTQTEAGAPFDSRIADGGTSYSGTGKSTGWIGGFSSVTGLSINTQAIQYREGGYNTTVHQVPGMTTFQPITFTRGVIYGADQAMVWMRGLFAAAAGNGLTTATARNFRMDVTVKVQDHPLSAVDPDDNLTKMGFKIHNAWISSLNYSDLDATNGAILFETMQLTHEGLSVFFTDSTEKAIV